MDIDISKLYACAESEDWLECMDDELYKADNIETTGNLYELISYSTEETVQEPEGLGVFGFKPEEEAKWYPYSYDEEKPASIKVGMYLQTGRFRNFFALKRAIEAIKKSDTDILVFPETCYIPFRESIKYRSIFSDNDRKYIFEKCLEFSREIGRAVVISTDDNQKIPYSVFANPNANIEKGEQECVLYAKHTMANNSAFDAKDYAEYVEKEFEIVNFRGFKIGMSICYDCNHAAFSRMYGVNNIDLMLNSTGGNVVNMKWYRYNKARAIENGFYNLVTMGEEGFSACTGVNSVYGFNANGGELKPVNLCGSSDRPDIQGGIYVYTIKHEPGLGTEENSFCQKETINKNSSFELPVGQIDSVLKTALKIKENLYVVKTTDRNVVLCVVENDDILKPEKVLPLLYAKELRKYKNRRYIVVNKFKKLDKAYFAEKLSVVLRVRSMENFCAVILESDIANKCYQCSKNRNSQTVKAVEGKFMIDLSRTTGPEAIWTNKMLMKAKWRRGYEHLIDLLNKTKC